MGNFDGPHGPASGVAVRVRGGAAAYGTNNELFRFDVAAGQMAALSPAGTEAVPALANMGLAVTADGRDGPGPGTEVQVPPSAARRRYSD